MLSHPTPVSRTRMTILRATYALVALGLIIFIWPAVFRGIASFEAMRTVVVAMLTTVSLLALVGIFRPLQLLPVLLFELTWKTIWLLMVALPLWCADALTERTVGLAMECLLGVVILPFAIPWGHLLREWFGARDATTSAPGSA